MADLNGSESGTGNENRGWRSWKKQDGGLRLVRPEAEKRARDQVQKDTQDRVQEPKGNILLLGRSGAGKSTLINAILGADRAQTGSGASVTDKMTIYEDGTLNLRLIDTRGWELGYFAQLKTRRNLQSWTSRSLKTRNQEEQIHVIWYCLEVTSNRIDKKEMEALSRVSKMWPGIPVILVLTKAYSEPEAEQFQTVVMDCIRNFRGSGKGNMAGALNIKAVIPVIASPYQFNDQVVIPQAGLNQLMDTTNQILPEAFRVNHAIMDRLDRKLKTASCQTLVAAAAASAFTIGAVPIPIPDAPVLVTIQTALVGKIISMFEVSVGDMDMKKVTQTLVGAGAVSTMGRSLLTYLKTIPGLNALGALLNGVVAAAITMILGEAALILMDKISAGEIDADNLEEIQNFADRLMDSLFSKYKIDLKELAKEKDPKKMLELLIQSFVKRGEKDSGQR